MRKHDEGLLIPATYKRLPPRREQDTKMAMTLLGDPAQKCVERKTITLELGMRFGTLGKRAIVASIVATRQGASIKDAIIRVQLLPNRLQVS